MKFDFGQSDWAPRTTLFVVFLGINDLHKLSVAVIEGSVAEGEEAQEVVETQLKVYEKMMDKV